MRIEYRSAHGVALEVAAGRLTPVQRTADIVANLRAHGCPENLIERREIHEIRARADAAMRRGVPQTEPSLAELKRRAAAVGQQIAEDAKRFQ
jgi:hypothetical protein